MQFDAALAAQDTFDEPKRSLAPTGIRPLSWRPHFPPTPESSPRHPLAFCNLVGYISFGDQWIQAQRAGQVF